MKITRGTLTERKRGVWRCEYRVDGQRAPSITVHAKNKTAARDLVEEEKALRAGVANSEWTVKRLLQAWLDDHLPDVPAPMTRYLYEYEAKHYLMAKPLGDKRVTELSTQDVIDYKRETLKRMGVSSVRHHLTLLRMALKWATKQRPKPLIAYNVAEDVKLPYLGPSPREHFTLEESMQMLEVTQAPQQAVIALGMLGLRRGEVIGLPRTALDFDNRIIRVIQQAQRINGQGWDIKDPKRGGRRDIGMPEWIVPILKDQLAWSMKRHNQTDLLFVSSAGGTRPLSERLPTLYVRQACLKAGIDCRDRCHHSLRHGYGQLMVDLNIPPRDIAHSMGQSSDREVRTRYGNHENPNRTRQMATAMDQQVINTVAEAKAKESGA